MSMQKFIELHYTTPIDCCNSIEEFIDETTNKIVKVGIGINKLKLDNYREKIAKLFVGELIGTYVSYKNDKLNSPKYYRIENFNNLDYGWIKVRQIKKNWVFSKIAVSKKIFPFGNYFKSMSESEILLNEIGTKGKILSIEIDIYIFSNPKLEG